jgi:hypothetical protein
MSCIWVYPIGNVAFVIVLILLGGSVDISDIVSSWLRFPKTSMRSRQGIL